MRHFALLLPSIALFVAAACSSGDSGAPTSDATGETATSPSDATGAAQADSGDTGSTKVLQWKAVAAPSGATLRRAAAWPDPTAKAPRYVIAGDAGLLEVLDEAGLGKFTPPPPESEADLRAVHVDPASGTLFIAGKTNRLAHFSGTDWYDAAAGDLPPSPSQTFNAIASSGADRAWVVGDQGAAWRWDGMSWTHFDVAGAHVTAASNLGAAWATGPDEVWIGAARLPGDATGTAKDAKGIVIRIKAGKSEEFFVKQAPSALFAGPDGAVFVVGGTPEAKAAFVARWNGAGFVATDLGFEQGVLDVGGADNTVFSCGYGPRLRRFNAGKWEIVKVESPPGTPAGRSVSPGSEPFVALAVHGAEELVVLQATRVLRYGVQVP